MKKIIVLFMLVFTLASCTAICDEACYRNKEAIRKYNAEEVEKRRAYELEKLKLQAEIEANKPVEVRIAEKEENLQQEANDSLNYLETSQKVRDGIDAVTVGYGIFKVLSE